MREAPLGSRRIDFHCEITVNRIFVADTNLFFECRKLEDLPWAELGAEVVVIALTKPVIGEIDKHKRGGGRTRKRALETFGRVREILTANETEAIIRDASPRVILRLVPALRPDQGLADILDYSLNDDRIIGIACAIAKRDSGTLVALLTDDGGAAATAQSVGLDFVLIDASWKRPAEQTTEAKMIADLKKDLAVYRAQEPDIQVRNVLADEAPTKVLRRVPLALPNETIDRLMERLEAGCPPKDDWTAPENETHADGTVITYKPADPETIETYRTEIYPNWLAACRSILETLHEGRVERETEIKLTFGVLNKGSRPASKMRIAFEARGNVMIKRPSSEDADPEKQAAVGAPRPMPVLPRPPEPPKWSRTVSKPTRPSKGVDLSTAGIAAQQGLILDSAIAKALRTHDLGAVAGLNHPGLRDVFRLPSAVEDLFARQSDFAALISRDQLDAGRLEASPMRLDSMRFSSILHEKHDPEGFYAQNWMRGELVRSGAYVCDLFRHLSAEELFEVNVLFPEEGDVTGVVICTVHAENLTEPVEMKIPVSRTIEEVDFTEIATDLVARCIEYGD